MPRSARLDTPGALHHIMVRGIDKKKIFRDDEDKALFLKRLGLNIVSGDCSVYAWALMDNHFHLLFKSGRSGVSEVMRKLLTWYAQYFNRKHNRSGHLFQNRYKSILCDEEEYLLTLVRYIHLNPVRAKKVFSLEELDCYPWSGHSAIVGNTKNDWMDTNYILERFGSRRKAAIDAYRSFISEDMDKKKNPLLTGGGLARSAGGWSNVSSMRRMDRRENHDERILGSGEFVDTIIREADEKEKRILKVRKTGRTIHTIIRDECKRAGIIVKELTSGGRRRKVSDLRAHIALMCLNELNLSLAEIARHLGVNTSSISKSVSKREGLL